jgi:myosin-1
VKKTTWQSGGTHELKFVKDNSVKSATVKPPNGKSCEIRVPSGLSADSKPSEKSVMGSSGMKKGGSTRPQQQSYQQPAQSYQQQPAKSYHQQQTPQFKLPTSNSSLAAAAKKKPPPPPPGARKLVLCRALYDYSSNEADELSFKAGDGISIVAKGDGWWTGSVGGRKGLFPVNYTDAEGQ